MLAQPVEVRALRTFKVDSAFPLVKLVSRVRPRILGCFTVGMMILLMERSRVMLCSCLSGVNRVAVDLSGFSFKSFLLVQLKISCK